MERGNAEFELRKSGKLVAAQVRNFLEDALML
jgi:hypothetical protein